MGCTISVDSEIVKIYTLEQKYNELASRIVKLERIEYISGILEQIKENEIEKFKKDIQIIKEQLHRPDEKDGNPEFNDD